MPEYQSVLTTYVPKTVNRSDGSGTFTLHNFLDLNGMELTARADVANIARGLLNQPVLLVTREEVKGRFTNRYLDFVGPAQTQQAYTNGASQAQAAQQTYQQQPPQQPIPPPTPTPPPQPQGPSEKDIQIMRQTAGKVAAEISKTSGEFWSNCLDLVEFFKTGMIPQPRQEGRYDDPPPYDDSSIPF